MTVSGANSSLPPHGNSTSGPVSTPLEASDHARTRFVGARHAAYCARWKAAHHTGFSWNWAAFFFGPGWLAYRKMHGGCAIFLVFAVFETAVEQITEMPPGMTATIYLLVAIGFGASGDRLYRRHVDLRIAKVIRHGRNPAAIDAALTRQGGTRICSALYFVATLIAMLVTVIILLEEPSVLS